MSFIIFVKLMISSASAASLIAMAFLSITPSLWFLTFAVGTLVWLFGEGIAKGAVNIVKGNNVDGTVNEKK
jgi:hypothetical protein